MGYEEARNTIKERMIFSSIDRIDNSDIVDFKDTETQYENTDIIRTSNNLFKIQLKKNINLLDYVVLNIPEGEFLYKIYQGHSIIRYYIPSITSIHRPIELFFTEIRIYDFKKLDSFIINTNCPFYKSFLFSKYLSVRELKNYVMTLFVKKPPLSEQNCRLWMTSESNFEELFNELKNKEISYIKHFKNKETHSIEYNCGIDFPGESLEFQKNVFLNELQPEKHIICLESADSMNRFIFTFNRKNTFGNCLYCKKKCKLNYSCKCEFALYCKEECLEAHKERHSKTCILHFEKNFDKLYVRTENSKNGISGIIK